MHWAEILTPSQPVAETFVRGTLVYVALFALLRFSLKRESGSVGVNNLLVVVLIADAAQNAMAGDYHSVPDGVLLVGTIIGWSVLLQWLAFRSPRLARLINAPPLMLVRNGRLLRQNMRRELVTEADLTAEMHKQGIGDLAKIGEAWLESDGTFSFVGQEDTPTERAQPPDTVTASGR